MSRRRKRGEDLSYAEWHRDVLPRLYGRVGHRQDMADRDWTEFCHWCKKPLLLVEEVLDNGQDILDKATTVTRHLAVNSGVDALLLAVRVERPEHIQAEIDLLWMRLLELYRAYAPTEFGMRRLYPEFEREVIRMKPEEWAERLLVVHRAHHLTCPEARQQFPVHTERLRAAQQRHDLLPMPTLFDDLA